MAFDTALINAYHMKYSVPDSGILKTFHFELNMKADNSATVGHSGRHLIELDGLRTVMIFDAFGYIERGARRWDTGTFTSWKMFRMKSTMLLDNLYGKTG